MKVVAFTGAGISKSAGIVTYAETPELRNKLSVEFKENNPKEFYEALDSLKNNVRGKEPTKAHKILAKFQIPIITMNVDFLHSKAGSKNVIEIHGNYLDDNIVLYGEQMHDSDLALNYIFQASREAKENNEEAILLVIGTSMQTAFAHIVTMLAEKQGMKVLYINNNADEEVEQFFKLMGYEVD